LFVFTEEVERYLHQAYTQSLSLKNPT